MGSGPPILRLFRFAPITTGFDAVLREVLVPEMMAMPGLIDVFAGRAGPGETGHRLVASVWSDLDAMQASLGTDLATSPFHPELLESTTDHDLTWLPVRFSFPFESPAPITVMRLAQGRVAGGQLEQYVEEARDGTRLDRETGCGPAALYLATRGEDGFVTLSLWTTWDALLAATGADYRQPKATRHATRLSDWDAEHLEVLPGMAEAPRPAAPGPAPAT